MAQQSESPDFTLLMIGAVARAVLQAGGGALAAHGVVVDDSTAETVIGAASTIGAFAWSIWQKKKIVKTAVSS